MENFAHDLTVGNWPIAARRRLPLPTHSGSRVKRKADVRLHRRDG
jgi:hypothetical protein